MTVTYSMLYVLLKSKCPLVDISVSVDAFAIQSIKIYQGTLTPECLYIVPNVKDFKVPAATDRQAFVFMDSDALGLRFPEGTPALLIGNWHDPNETMMMITDLMLSLERWQTSLYQCNMDNSTPGMMLKRMYDLIPQRLVFENENRRHIYEYPAYDSSPNGLNIKYASNVSASPTQPDYASFQQFLSMNKNKVVYSIPDCPNVAIFRNDEINNVIVIRKCYDGTRLQGKLILVYPHTELTNSTLMDGYCRIVDAFCSSFELKLANSSSGAIREGSDAMHLSFHNLLFSPSSELPRIVLGYLSELNWQQDDSYLICAIQIESTSIFMEVAGYLCGMFEKTLPHCIALRAKGQIILLLNTSAAEVQDTIIEHVRRLRSEASYRNCYVAFSNQFDDILLAPGYYQQCDFLLRHSKKWSVNEWVFYYKNHSMDYIAAHLTAHFSVKYICHPGVLALYYYDREHGTELLTTLYYYMKYHLNTSDAAAAIPIHRTTFTKRIEKIESIYPFQYQSVDSCLHILLSLKLLFGTDQEPGRNKELPGSDEL